MFENKKTKDNPILTCPHCGDFIIIMKIGKLIKDLNMKRI